MATQTKVLYEPQLKKRMHSSINLLSPKFTPPTKMKKSRSLSMHAFLSNKTEKREREILKDSTFKKKWLIILGATVIGILIGILMTGYPEVTQTVFLNAFIKTNRITSILSTNFSEGAQALWAQWNDADIMNYLQTFQLPLWDPSEKIVIDYTRPGLKKRPGMKAHYPIALIPGFLTTHLELWEGDSCGEDYFGQSVWGHLTMVRLLLSQPSCWAQHMALDAESGLDPKGYKIRAAEGIHGLDYLFPSYWVWARLIRNLADLGYDTSSILPATYDWRLGTQNLEIRDGYFTRLKINIEHLVNFHNRKVVAIGHSLGSNVFYFFMKWVENISPGWTDKNIHAFVNIGGPLLGTAKGLATLLSGEMRDSAETANFRAYVADRMFNPIDRLHLFRSWTSVGNLLPKGGNIVWGDNNGAPDDQPDQKFSKMLRFSSDRQPKYTTEESLNFMWQSMFNSTEETKYAKNLKKLYSFGFSTNASTLNEKEGSKYWTNPLESALPNAPRMKIYCLYGIGKTTERGYYYRDQEDTNSSDPHLEGVRYSIDSAEPNAGVILGSGDGTVPLLSLGYMCVDGWKRELYNPSKAAVYTREYFHRPVNLMQDLRGGQETGDHVDIMGNYKLIADLLEIVSGSESVDSDSIQSNIREISEKISARAFS